MKILRLNKKEARARISDLTVLDVVFKEWFKCGGFIAGGFMRQTLLAGMSPLTPYKSYSDVDFYFYNKEFYELAAKKFERAFRPSAAPFKLHSSSTIWNSTRYNYVFREYKAGIQPIPFKFGTPIEVLNAFDLINCCVAYDGEWLYIHEDFDSLHEDSYNCLLEISEEKQTGSLFTPLTSSRAGEAHKATGAVGEYGCNKKKLPERVEKYLNKVTKIDQAYFRCYKYILNIEELVKHISLYDEKNLKALANIIRGIPENFEERDLLLLRDFSPLLETAVDDLLENYIGRRWCSVKNEPRSTQAAFNSSPWLDRTARSRLNEATRHWQVVAGII